MRTIPTSAPSRLADGLQCVSRSMLNSTDLKMSAVTWPPQVLSQIREGSAVWDAELTRSSVHHASVQPCFGSPARLRPMCAP